MMPRHERDLDTPAVTVDLRQVERNICRMQQIVESGGARLRPHIKTHKSVNIATMQLSAGASGVTTAKLGEAKVMAAAGVGDILVANELVGALKLKRFVELAESAQVRCCIDDFENARLLSEIASTAKITVDVLIDVEVGLGRAGLQPEKAIALGKRVSGLPRLAVAGVFTYGGNPPLGSNASVRHEFATAEARKAVEVAAELRALGLSSPIVSVAGTPSAPGAATVTGVTEVRPGTYVFYDANYLRRGLCTLSECALRIRATVVSRSAPDRAVIDAGSKTLSSDHGPGTAGRGARYYGLIVEAPDSYIDLLWEEHAVVRLDELGSRLSVGDIVHIVPFHACPVVNLADSIIGLDGESIEAVVQIDARGRTS